MHTSMHISRVYVKYLNPNLTVVHSTHTEENIFDLDSFTEQLANVVEQKLTGRHMQI